MLLGSLPTLTNIRIVLHKKKYQLFFAKFTVLQQVGKSVSYRYKER